MKREKSKTSIELGYVRGKMVKDGAYDGRFAPKYFVNRKKESKKNACRGHHIEN
jgi:hypothetical protein